MADWTRAAICGLALALAAPAALRADSAPPAAQSADPVYDAQKAAFDALPEADRKAIQDALIWSGHYNGVVDGVFGKRTRDAIIAYQTSLKAQADGTVDAAQAAAMAAATQKVRAAVKFQVFTDDKTGIKIGAPLKILDKRVDAGDVRLTKADGSVALDLMSASGADAKLGAMFAALTADKDSRKITLKLSRPDYFVVSGEEAGRKFYQRTAKAPAGAPDPTLVRGFRFTYPIAQSGELDKISVAIADSFEPFPAAASSPTTPVASKETPVPAPAPAPAPSKPAFSATGLVVAPGQALSAISAADCPNPTIDGKPTKFIREDRELGLSLLGVEPGVASQITAQSMGAIGPDLVALSYGAEEPNGRVTLNVTGASPLTSTQIQAHPSLLAALPRQSAGAPVFDRMGGLVAIVARSASEPKLVAGVAPLAAHEAIGLDAIQRFLSLAPGASPKSTAAGPLGAGQIAAMERASLVAIYCRR
jgi:putative peptidoglycan binding protein